MSQTERATLDRLARAYAEDAPSSEYAVICGCVVAFAADRPSLH
jgi:hypothetical protein